jgi:hypothetical protein
MFLRSVMKGCVLVAGMMTGIVAVALPGAGQSIQDIENVENADRQEDVQTVQHPPSDARAEIFAELVKRNELRSARLREYSSVRTYSIANLSGKIHARETVRMEYIAPDSKTFVTTSEEGSSLVRHMVLNRLIKSESSAAAGKEHHDSSITPANYTFGFLGEEDVDGHHCYVVEAFPKRKDKYLFEGKVWIDSRDFAVVRIAGHPAKRLSFWITRADFVRQYQKIGDFWLPARDETSVSVRLYGKKVLTINHLTYTVNGVKTAAVIEQNPYAFGISEKPKSD